MNFEPVNACRKVSHLKLVTHLDFKMPGFSPLVFFLLIFLFGIPFTAAGGIEHDYHLAELSYERLLKDPEKQKERLNWLVCTGRFRSVYTAQPDGPRADDALFMIGRVYSELYKVSSGLNDRQEALDCYCRLLKRFPDSPYRPEAKKAIAELRIEKEKHPAHKEPPTTDLPTDKGLSKPKPLTDIEELALDDKICVPVGEKRRARVTDLRFWSNPSYTRVVIDADKEVPYSYRLLKKDPAIGKPQRLYIDLSNARMGGRLRPIVPIGDDLLSDARAGQYAADTVRVVLDIKSIDDFSIFSLKNPFRIVLDINGIPKKRPSKKSLKEEEIRPPSGDIGDGSLAKQLALGVRRIVIDPGHGGKDPGAVGYDRNVLEKNVALEVSKRVARKVRKRLGCEVILTRDRDVFLSLEERTAIANTKNADIFISLHANAHRNRRVRGIETYFLNLATDNEAILVAARENATSAKNISDLEAILNDLMKNSKVNESSRLAGYVQRAMVRKLKTKYKKVNDKGVKQAPFYVLLGAEMPCILVEIAFISNKAECSRLNTAAYQEAVADAIVVGIQDYIKAISPTVLTKAAML